MNAALPSKPKPFLTIPPFFDLLFLLPDPEEELLDLMHKIHAKLGMK